MRSIYNLLSTQTSAKSKYSKLAALLLISTTISASAYPIGDTNSYWNTRKMQKVDLRDVSLKTAARFLSNVCNVTVLPSKELSDKKVSIYLKNTTINGAVNALCQTNGFFPRFDKDANTIYILTSKEMSQSLDFYSDDSHKAIQLLYPRVLDVAESIQSLYLDRVVWVKPENGGDLTEDIQAALERMDLLDERREFESGNSSSAKSSSSSRNSNSSRDSSGSRRSSTSVSNMGQNEDDNETELQELMASDKGGILSRLLQSGGKTSLSQLMRKPAKIYLSVMTESNILLVRSADPKAVALIETMVQKLDRPTPQVLLETKILEINIADMNKQGIDWMFASQSGNNSGGFASGAIEGARTLTASELLNNAESVGAINTALDGAGSIGLSDLTRNLVTRGSGFDSRSMVFNHISDTFRLRLEMLETQNRVTKLATPSLLVADNEASKVFVGTNTKFLESVERAANVSSDTGAIAEGSGELTPVLGDRNVGTSLLITPRIHADNTVTLRILQEYTDFGLMRNIDYGGETTVKVQDFEQQIVTTTVVAGSGNMLVVGGLIREGLEDCVEGIPYLMGLPYVGGLFKRTTKRRTRKELVLLIRPYILLAPGDDKGLFGEYISKISQHPSASEDMPALNVTDPKDIARPVTKSHLKNDSWYKGLINNLETWSVEHQ